MFSIRTLLLAVAVAAIGAVGLTTRNVWWAGVMSTLTWISVAAAIVASLVWSDRKRWPPIGYANFAGLYVFMIMSQSFAAFSPAMLTTKILGATWRAIDVPLPHPESPPMVHINGEMEDVEEYALSINGVRFERGELRQWMREVRSFFVVAHCLWAWLFGFLGALLAAYLARERVSRHTETRPQPPQ